MAGQLTKTATKDVQVPQNLRKQTRYTRISSSEDMDQLLDNAIKEITNQMA